MFGQNKPAFGTGTSGFAGFGTTNTSTPFGLNTFGNKATTSAFGGTTAFGSTGSSMFGGASNPTGTTGMFGGGTTGGFGQNPTTNTFGGFGTNPSTMSTTTPLFGQNQNTQGSSLFGTNTSSTFNQPKPAFGGFGGTGNSLFGQPQQQQPQTSLFGQSAVNTGQGLFGTGGFITNTVNNVSGTTFKFNPLTGSDTMMKNGISTNINTRHQCITCMKEYETKSLEELRMEDYAANRKGQQQQTGGLFSNTSTQQTSLFGNPTSNANTLFGQNQNKSVFGTTSNTGFFGQNTQQQPAPSMFTKPATTPFGQPATSNNVTFNLPNAASGTSLFGQNPSKPFGTVTPQLGGNLFGGGATTQATGSFGTNTSSTGFGMFGSQPNQNIGLFNNQNKSLFGTPTTSAAGLSAFGQPAVNTTGGLFGVKPTNTFGTGFGTGSTMGNAFGSNLNTGTNLFGQQNKPAATGFGIQPTTGLGTGLNTGGTSSLFGLNANKPSLFGSGGSTFGTVGLGTNTVGGMNLGGTGFGTGSSLGFGSNFNTTLGSTPTANAQDLSLAAQQQILALASSPFGDSPLFKNVQGTGKREEILKPTNPAAQKALAEQAKYKVSPHINIRIKAKPLKSPSGSKSGLFDGFDEDDSSQGTFIPRISVKKLVLRNKNNGSMTSPMTLPITPTTPILPRECVSDQDTPLRVTAFKGKTFSARSGSEHNDSSLFLIGNKSHILPNTNGGDLFDTSSARDVSEDKDENVNPNLVVLKRPGYYTTPTLEEMNESIDRNGACILQFLVIGRSGYGVIVWDGEINVTGMNLDEIVHIRHKEVTVYPNDDDKPVLGVGLNRPADITLERVWPTDKSDQKSPIKSLERLTDMGYEDKLVSVCNKLGATFLDYTAATGTWHFKVKHFSKYGITDSDEENGSDPKKLKLGEQKKVPPPPGSTAQTPTTCTPLLGRAEPGTATSTLMPQMTSTPLQGTVPHPQLPGSGLSHDFLNNQDETMDEEYQKSSDEDDSGELMPGSFCLPEHERSQRVQLMKMSFFDDDSPQMTDEAISDPAKILYLLNQNRMKTIQHSGKKETPRMIGSKYLCSDLTSYHTSAPIVFSPPTIHRVDSVRPVNVKLKTVPMHYNEHVVMYKESLLSFNVPNKLDSTHLRKCAFRVGWGPNLTLAYLPEPGIHSSEVCITNVSTFCNQTNDLKTVVDSLNMQLAYTNGSLDECPRFRSKEGSTLIHAHADLLRETVKDNKGMLRVWELCEALFGDVPEGEHLQVSSAHLCEMARKELLSNWLKVVAEESVEKDLCLATGEYESMMKILAYLSGYKLVAACQEASNTKCHQLSMLLSQVNTLPVQRYVHEQLEKWVEEGADEFVAPEYLELMIYIAGIPVWQGSANGPRINTCQFLDWKRTLGVHLWYFCSQCSSIADVVSQYEDAFQGRTGWEIYSARPLPAYIEDTVEEVSMVYTGPFDVCFHLLKLFSHHAYRLENMLMPTSFTSNPMDYSLSWFLNQALSCIGYRHLSPDSRANVHVSFAAQLEEAGMWHWAIFVLLHLEVDSARKSAVQDMLGRHLNITCNEDDLKIEQLVANELCIPPAWIYEAKAVRASIEKDHISESWYWLKGEKWNNCHKILNQHIISDAIINEDYKAIAAMLKHLAPPERSLTIENWHTQGSIIWDYIQLQEQLSDHINKKYVDGTDLQEMITKLNNIGFGIHQFQISCLKDRLCQSEIAKRTAAWFRFALSFMHPTKKDISDEIKQKLPLLPMPEDYAMIELRHIQNHVMANNTS